jgi:hypothetical protein
MSAPKLMMSFVTIIRSMRSDAKWLAWFEQQFMAVAGSDGLIDFNRFKQALHLKEVYCVAMQYTILP